MTLRQEVEQLIAQWQGSDAMDLSAKRDQLVNDLVALIEHHRPNADALTPSLPDSDATCYAAA